MNYDLLRNSLINKYSCYCEYQQLKNFFHQIPNDMLSAYENYQYFFQNYPYQKRRSIYNPNHSITLDQKETNYQQNQTFQNGSFQEQVDRRNLSSIIKRRQTSQSLSIQSLQNNQEFTGLKNIESNCYFNSLIQLLLFHRDFRKKILQFKGFQSNLTPDQELKLQTIQELQKLFALIIRQQNQPVDPSVFLQKLFRQHNNDIQFGKQNDITEFFDTFNQQISDITQFENKNIPTQDILSNSLDGKLINETILNDVQRQRNIQFTSGEEDFNCIIVNVEDENLQRGLKNKFIYNVQNLEYQNKFYDGTKREWILQLPSLLIIQISRVQFDKKYQKVYKNNSKFLFEEEFYIDKYLYKNHDVVNQLQDQIDQINQEIIQIDEELSKLTYFGNKNMDILESLNHVHTYLHTYNDFDNDQQTRYKIQHVLNQIQNQKEQFYKDKQNLELKKTNILSNINKNKYRLKGIVIHDGNHIAGHYFLYMVVQHKWYVFNDTFIEKIDKEKVFKDAFGDGISQKNAYCLAYEHQSVDDFDNPVDEQIPDYLSQQINQYEQNQKKFQVLQTIESIFQYAIALRRDLQNYQDHQWFMRYHPRIQNFLQFVFDLNNEQKNIQILNFCLLQESINKQNDGQQQIDIWSILKDENYREQFLQYCNLNSLQITQSEQINNNQLHQLKIEYCNSVNALMDLSMAQQSLSQGNLDNYQENLRLYFQRPQQYNFCYIIYNHFIINCIYLLLDAWYHFSQGNLNIQKFTSYIIDSKETILFSFARFNNNTNYNELIRYLTIMNNFYKEAKNSHLNQYLRDSLEQIGQTMKQQNTQHINTKSQKDYKIKEFFKFIEDNKQIDLSQDTQDMLFGIQEIVAPCFNFIICNLKSQPIY